MSTVRLKTNLISGGAFHKRGTIVDIAIVPEHLRNEQYIDSDLENRGGRVLLLRDLSFMSIPVPDSSGIPCSYPVHIAAGELFDLARVPESKRPSLVEGLDFKSDWTYQELEEMQKEQEDIYAGTKQFETEPVASTRRMIG